MTISFGLFVAGVVWDFCFANLGKIDDQNVEAFLKSFGSLVPKRYSYLEIKKITNSFKNKLGEGGFGGVYKGKLHDGRLVAAKLLKESNGDGEQFINEVASISWTSHVNIVSLLVSVMRVEKGL